MNINYTNDTAEEILEKVTPFMDDEIREELHRKLAPCDPATYLEAYLSAHRERYGEEFQLP